MLQFAENKQRSAGLSVTASQNIALSVVANPRAVIATVGAQGPAGAAGNDGVVQSVVAGSNVTVDATDPANPIVSAAAGYTDEQAQDAVGTILSDAGDIDFTYVDATPAISAVIRGNTVMPYAHGAVGDGTTDDTAAMQAAIATTKHVDLRGGNFKITTMLTLADNQRMFNGTLTKGANIDMLTIGTTSILNNVIFKGDGANFTGRGIVVPSGKLAPQITGGSVTNMSGYCLEFEAADAGTSSLVQSCNMSRTNGSLEAIKLPTDTGTGGLRTFIDVKGSGAALYDLGGSNGTVIVGGNSLLMTWTDDTNGLIMYGHRMAFSPNIKGTSHWLGGCSVSGTMTLKTGASGICINNCVHQGNSLVIESGVQDCTVFPNDAALTDNSGGADNDLFNHQLSWTPVLTCGVPGDLAITYSVQFGVATKIGRMVIATFNIITSAFTHSTASGSVVITGLPYTSASVTNQKAVGSLAFSGFTKANYTQMLGDIAPNATQLSISCAGSAQSITNAAIGDFPTGGGVVLQGTIMYRE